MSRNEDSDETIAFLFGDMGTAIPYNTFFLTQEESIATMKWILRDIEALGYKPAFISHIGDISYARGYSWFWDHFFLLRLNLLHPKSHTMCALVIMSIIGLHSLGDLSGLWEFMERMGVVNVAYPSAVGSECLETL